MRHTAGVSMPETSVPSSGRNKPPARILGGSLLIACSSRSDSGVRREGREREKDKEEKREGGQAFLRSQPYPTPSFFFSFSNLFVVSPRSDRLEQATLLIPERLFFEVRQTLYILACCRLRDSRVRWKRKHENKAGGNFFLFSAPPTFRVPFSFASFPLSESLEQANSTQHLCF